MMKEPSLPFAARNGTRQRSRDFRGASPLGQLLPERLVDMMSSERGSLRAKRASTEGGPGNDHGVVLPKLETPRARTSLQDQKSPRSSTLPVGKAAEVEDKLPAIVQRMLLTPDPEFRRVSASGARRLNSREAQDQAFRGIPSKVGFSENQDDSDAGERRLSNRGDAEASGRKSMAPRMSRRMTLKDLIESQGQVADATRSEKRAGGKQFAGNFAELQATVVSINMQQQDDAEDEGSSHHSSEEDNEDHGNLRHHKRASEPTVQNSATKTNGTRESWKKRSSKLDQRLSILAGARGGSLKKIEGKADPKTENSTVGAKSADGAEEHVDKRLLMMRNARLIQQILQEIKDDATRCHDKWLKRKAENAKKESKEPLGSTTPPASHHRLDGVRTVEEQAENDARRAAARLRRKRGQKIRQRLNMLHPDLAEALGKQQFEVWHPRVSAGSSSQSAHFKERYTQGRQTFSISPQKAMFETPQESDSDSDSSNKGLSSVTSSNEGDEDSSGESDSESPIEGSPKSPQPPRDGFGISSPKKVVEASDRPLKAEHAPTSALRGSSKEPSAPESKRPVSTILPPRMPPPDKGARPTRLWTAPDVTRIRMAARQLSPMLEAPDHSTSRAKESFSHNRPPALLIPGVMRRSSIVSPDQERQPEERLSSPKARKRPSTTPLQQRETLGWVMQEVLRHRALLSLAADDLLESIAAAKQGLNPGQLEEMQLSRSSGDLTQGKRRVKMHASFADEDESNKDQSAKPSVKSRDKNKHENPDSKLKRCLSFEAVSPRTLTTPTKMRRTTVIKEFGADRPEGKMNEPIRAKPKKEKLPEIPRLRYKFRDQRFILSDNWRSKAQTLKRYHLQVSDRLGLDEKDWASLSTVYHVTVPDLVDAAKRRLEDDQRKAAILIQALWRSRIAAKFTHRRLGRRKELYVRIQRWWRFYRKWILPVKRRIQVERPKVHRAAAKIQARVRGLMFRRRLAFLQDVHHIKWEMQMLCEKLGRDEILSLIKSQSAIRGWLARKRTKDLRAAIDEKSVSDPPCSQVTVSEADKPKDGPPPGSRLRDRRRSSLYIHPAAGLDMRRGTLLLSPGNRYAAFPSRTGNGTRRDSMAERRLSLLRGDRKSVV